MRGQGTAKNRETNDGLSDVRRQPLSVRKQVGGCEVVEGRCHPCGSACSTSNKKGLPNQVLQLL